MYAYSPEDFEFGKELGAGSYSTVVRARLRKTREEFAVKILEKRHLIKLKKTETVKAERDILNKLCHPSIIRLFATFQDAEHLYFVEELATGGELMGKNKVALPVECARFYTAEIVSAVEYMHSEGVIHRDLKPENILVSGDGHIKLTDFGTATFVGPEESAAGRRPTFCGSPFYVSPEVLRSEPATQRSDFWSLGCIVFQLLTGVPPFSGESEFLLFQNISRLGFSFPPGVDEAGKDFVARLLRLDPLERLTIPQMKQHPFLASVDFATLYSQTPPMPPRPPATAAVDDEGGDGAAAVAGGAVPAAAAAASSASGAPPLGADGPWRRFLMENEHVVWTSLVEKRVGLFAKRRQLILTSFPRLIYVDPEEMVQKGEIRWCEHMQPELKDARHFLIHTPQRTYNLEDLSDGAARWVDEITRMHRLVGAAAPHTAGEEPS